MEVLAVGVGAAILAAFALGGSGSASAAGPVADPVVDPVVDLVADPPPAADPSRPSKSWWPFAAKTTTAPSRYDDAAADPTRYDDDAAADPTRYDDAAGDPPAAAASPDDSWQDEYNFDATGDGRQNDTAPQANWQDEYNFDDSDELTPDVPNAAPAPYTSSGVPTAASDRGPDNSATSADAPAPYTSAAQTAQSGTNLDYGVTAAAPDAPAPYAPLAPTAQTGTNLDYGVTAATAAPVAPAPNTSAAPTAKTGTNLDHGVTAAAPDAPAPYAPLAPTAQTGTNLDYGVTAAAPHTPAAASNIDYSATAPTFDAAVTRSRDELLKQGFTDRLAYDTATAAFAEFCRHFGDFVEQNKRGVPPSFPPGSAEPVVTDSGEEYSRLAREYMRVREMAHAAVPAYREQQPPATRRYELWMKRWLQRKKDKDGARSFAAFVNTWRRWREHARTKLEANVRFFAVDMMYYVFRKCADEMRKNPGEGGAALNAAGMRNVADEIKRFDPSGFAHLVDKTHASIRKHVRSIVEYLAGIGSMANLFLLHRHLKTFGDVAALLADTNVLRIDAAIADHVVTAGQMYSPLRLSAVFTSTFQNMADYAAIESAYARVGVDKPTVLQGGSREHGAAAALVVVAASLLFAMA